MRRIVQHLGSGETVLEDSPAPQVGAATLLIRSHVSLVSSGTERMLVDFGRAGWIEKARQQPHRVRQVVDKMRTDGVLQTIDTVRSKLDQPIPLGYSNVGEVVAVGAHVTGFRQGDRVVSNGSHAELVAVPRNLCALVPNSVDDRAAAFTVIGAIGLQGVRLAQPSIGESFVVVGLGLIGLLTVQILRANGCQVLGIDFDESKLALGRQFGAQVVNPNAGGDPIAAASTLSGGRGVDGVIITAATESSEPVRQAAHMCRKRGRIVLVGVTGLELDRADFYEKELTFQVSCSYGPGRYDPQYEESGHDYPIGFVRWTEQRNFEAMLGLMAGGQIDVEPLVSHVVPFADATRAYDILLGGDASLGILLEYDGSVRPDARSVEFPQVASRKTRGTPRVSVIGAGNYAGRVLIPALAASGVKLQTLASTGGVNGGHYARKHGFARFSTDVDDLLTEDVDGLVIATRHDSHAELVMKALRAGKSVFCEKPLALTHSEIDEVEEALGGAQQRHEPPSLMVGFNRRFSPLVIRMKELISAVSAPMAVVVTVNAGALPPDHWAHDPSVGGGRILGEGCHFIDLIRHLCGSRIEVYSRSTLASGGGDTATIDLTLESGSIGTLHYWANGNSGYPKERVEVFVAGRVLQLDNFRTLRGFGWPGFKRLRLAKQDKGQSACIAAWLASLRDGRAPIDMIEMLEVSRVAVSLARPVPTEAS